MSLIEFAIGLEVCPFLSLPRTKASYHVIRGVEFEQKITLDRFSR